MYNVLVVDGKVCWGRDVHRKAECESYVKALRAKGYQVKVVYTPDFAEGDYEYWDIEPIDWLKF